jgi:hypothetical protein
MKEQLKGVLKAKTNKKAEEDKGIYLTIVNFILVSRKNCRDLAFSFISFWRCQSSFVRKELKESKEKKEMKENAKSRQFL